MSPSDVVNLPPSPRISDYPALTAVAAGIFFTGILLVISGRFDKTGGTLTISVLIVLAMIAVVAVCLFYTIPSDQATAAVIGGLVAAFGAVVAYWLGKPRGEQ
jgi:O-antigen/teichoic acid export membrane protein